MNAVVKMGLLTRTQCQECSALKKVCVTLLSRWDFGIKKNKDLSLFPNCHYVINLRLFYTKFPFIWVLNVKTMLKKVTV